MIHAEQWELLEMAGYEAGRTGNVCYRNTDWNDEQVAAYRKGFNDGTKVKESRGGLQNAGRAEKWRRTRRNG